MRIKHFILSIILLSCFSVVYPCLSQQLGTSALPEDLLLTTLVIETKTSKEIEQFVPLQGLKIPGNIPKNSNLSSIDSMLYVKVKRQEDAYHQIGSGVLISHLNINFIVTANHVVPRDSDLYFRVPQHDGTPVHRSHKANLQETGIDWIRSENDDLALTVFLFNPKTDNLKLISSDQLFAPYDSVALGDDVFVLGYPSSVIISEDPDVHFVRNGIISSKLSNGKIIVDSFLFPGNSGGPVFWKPAHGLKTKGLFTGPTLKQRNPSLVGIVSAFLPYREEARSVQTNRTRIIFEENTGLSVVTSASRILDLLNTEECVKVISRIKATTKK